MTRRVSPDPLGLSGQSLLDRYVVETAIAQGGMAVIYRGRDLRLQRPVCIKVFQRLARGAAGYRTAYEHFVQEAFALSQFNHPNTLRIYDFGYLPREDDSDASAPEDSTAPFQISELLEGGTLGQRIRSEGPLDGRAALELLVPIAGALAEAHARGIVHRDIKPSNILYGLAGEARIVKLCDFGIAKAGGELPHRADDTIASAGPKLRLYSPGWSAPEQIHGLPVGPAADVFALGLVLAYVLTGQPIFTATRPDEALIERIDSDAHVARFLDITGVRAAIAEVVRGACREAVSERYAGVGPMIEALREAIEAPDDDSLVTVPLGRMQVAPAIAALPALHPDDAPEATPAPRLIVDPQGDGEVLVAGRRMRLVPMAASDQLDIGGDGPWLRSPARFRITLTPSSSTTPRLHVKGLNCFVARAGARPSTAVDVEADMDVNLLAPDRRMLDGMRCTLGRAGAEGRLYDLGHVILAVPAEASAVLLDLGPGRELALIHRTRVAARPARRDAMSPRAPSPPPEFGEPTVVNLPLPEHARNIGEHTGRTPAPVAVAARASPPPLPRAASHAMPSGTHVVRSRAYSFVLDPVTGQPVELGSGRFAKAYLGEERWLESKTALRRQVAIKILQKGVTEQDALRFQLEKELLERVQGHPNIITLYASGESDNEEFIPAGIRDKVENDFMILELADMSLEERLKGSRNRGLRDDLLAYPMRDRLFRVLEYMLPVASAIEYAHLQRNIVHRDLKPANILIKLPTPGLQGSTLGVRVADFNVGKVHEDTIDISMTTLGGVPGTLFFQSPEQETNAFELLVNVQQGSVEVDYFEDFFMYLSQNDTFQIFNRNERYGVAGADRAKRKLFLSTPFAEPSETNVRAKIIKSVDRPADIYSLGTMFYYLVSGAYGNPKTLYDAFHKFIEYEKTDEENNIEGYLAHEYEVINSLRQPQKKGEEKPVVAPADRFFSYKHYLDGNGELIDLAVMRIIAKAMIRNKPDSYCQAWDINTTGISDLVADLLHLYAAYGVDVSARSAMLGRFVGTQRPSWLSRVFAKVMRRSPTSRPRISKLLRP